jgi:hypothetical protein
MQRHLLLTAIEEKTMTPDELKAYVDAERSKYAKSWAVNSAAHEAAGDYVWMASFLKNFTQVLEIGVGDGLSTLQLLNGGHQVIGVDANRDCLDRAHARIGSSFTTDRIYREKRSTIDGKLFTSYEPINDSSNKPQALLIEGDILNDIELQKWLIENGKFDAVACWLIGTNSADMIRHCQQGSSGPDPQMYRLRIQNLLYDLGGKLLRSNGALHFVDRGTIPVKETRESYIREIADMHHEQAEGTSMSVDVNAVELRQRSLVAGGVDLTGPEESNRNNLVYTSVLAFNN